MQRIHVVGTSGSGKTTLARNLAERIGLPHIEMDALHWGPNWTPVPEEVFRQRVIEAISQPAWSIDGNYGRVRALIWSRADTVVWLDYPLSVILGRLLIRTADRAIGHVELWSGNHESLRRSLFSRDSILLWALQTYQRRRREYPQLMVRPENAHIAFIRLRSPKQSARWLATVESLRTPFALTPSTDSMGPQRD